MNQTLKAIIRACLPRSITRQRILAGPLRGYSLVTSWHDYPGAITGRTERPLLNWFAKQVRIGETWLDIGAQYGYTAIALSRGVGASGRVFAFEPMLSTAGYLSQTRALNGLSQLTIIPHGLGAVADLEVMQLPVTRGMIDSTIVKSKWLESILVANLDWLWPRLCGAEAQIHGVKIDVQGMEIDVLRGMTAILQRWQPRLVVEVHAGIDRAALLEIVKASGYSQQAVPIEPLEGETMPRYVDNRSYAFFPNPTF
jgi:FkbM family methyltransferase